MMRQLLLCGGLDGSEESLCLLQEVVPECEPDGILFAGGILAPGGRKHRNGGPSRIPRLDGLFYEHFFETLSKLPVFCGVIPGPQDTPLNGFLRLAMNAEVDFPNVYLLHEGLVEEGDICLGGIGGQLNDTIDGSNGIVRCSRTAAEYFLRPLASAKRPLTVLLLGVPPTGPLGGEEGNAIAADLIDSLHPSLCVALGSTQRRGTQRIAHTLVVNPGRLADASAVWLDWSLPVDERVKLVNLRALAAIQVPNLC
jgi:Metallophosphoesterase, calcineurin superfamily